MWVWSLGQEDPLKKDMATHTSILAQEILWTEEADGYSLGVLKSIRCNLATKQQSQWIKSSHCIPYIHSILNKARKKNNIFRLGVNRSCVQADEITATWACGRFVHTWLFYFSQCVAFVSLHICLLWGLVSFLRLCVLIVTSLILMCLAQYLAHNRDSVSVCR